MKIVCAASVAHGAEAFSTLGETRILPDGAITREALAGADALVVRSKTRVGPALLAGTPVRFVGTCTAGLDHLDGPGLARAGVTVAAAPGSNAPSVAEYITAALLAMEARSGVPLRGLTLAVIGVGQVGRRVAAKARLLGLPVRLNDPPLFDATGDAAYRPLDEVLPEADVVTLHVPLIDDGPHPTRRLAGPAFFARLRRGALFLNASRGEVVDEDALLAARRDGRLRGLVLDVFEREPLPRRDVVGIADLATPHIAGYSREGRIAGTTMVLEALARWAGRPVAWAPPRGAAREIDGSSGSLEAIVRQAYDVAGDDRALRATLSLEDPARGAAFTRLRNQYPERPEFPGHGVRGAPEALQPVLRELGFRAG